MNFPCVIRYVLHVSYRGVHRQVLELRERQQAEAETERADEEAGSQERTPVDAPEFDRRKVRQHETRFAAPGPAFSAFDRR
jgi:hypothetical protein